MRFTLQETLDDLPVELWGTRQFSQDYWAWERQAELEILHRGFKQVQWSMDDGDSFGPLVRRVRAVSCATGKLEVAYYVLRVKGGGGRL